MKTVGQFLEFVGKYESHLWFIPRVGGQISLGTSLGYDFLETLVRLENPQRNLLKHRSKPGHYERMGKLLDIDPAFAYSLGIATMFREFDMPILLAPHEVSKEKVDKLVSLRKRIIEILNVVDTNVAANV